MKNKHFFIPIFLFLIGGIFLLYSCNKTDSFLNNELEVTSNEELDIYEKSPNSKDDLIDMFVNLTEKEITNLEFDLVEVLKKELNSTEKEDIVIQRIAKNYSDEGSKKASMLFSDFNEITKTSFFDASDAKVTEFMKNYKPLIPLSIDCIFCTAVESCNEQSDFVYYRVSREVNYPIVSRDCNRSKGSDDCDNSYDWIPPSNVYDNPQNFDLVSYTQNSVYRFIMKPGFSGFRRQNSDKLSTFLGNRHELAMLFG